MIACSNLGAALAHLGRYEEAIAQYRQALRIVPVDSGEAPEVADVTPGTDIEKAPGKGLGVVATDFNDNGLRDLFVANDTVQNFLFGESA